MDRYRITKWYHITKLAPNAVLLKFGDFYVEQRLGYVIIMLLSHYMWDGFISNTNLWMLGIKITDLHPQLKNIENIDFHAIWHGTWK